jgi:Reverse transcriptase (RNA-dependent DNA polymerase)
MSYLLTFLTHMDVDHNRLIQILRACKVLEKVVYFMESTVKGSSYVVHTGYGPISTITLDTGLKQGDPAAPVIFIIFLKALIRYIKKYVVGYKFKYPFKHCVLASSNQEFCDDTVVTTDVIEEILQVIEILEDFE